MKSIEEVVQHNLRQLRKDRDLTQKDLAQVLGLQTQTVSAMEAGRRNIPLRYLDILCKEYSLPPEFFFRISLSSNIIGKLGMDLLSSLEDVAHLSDESRKEIKSYIDYINSRDRNLKK